MVTGVGSTAQGMESALTYWLNGKPEERRNNYYILETNKIKIKKKRVYAKNIVSVKEKKIQSQGLTLFLFYIKERNTHLGS